MGVDISDTVLGAAIGAVTVRTLNKQLDKDGGGSSSDGSTGGSDGSADSGSTTVNQGMSEEQLEELIELQKRQYGGPESIDAYASEVLDLPDGAVGTVTVTPRDGFDLRVKRLYFDRRDGHDYSHLVDGTEVSANHQANLRSARKVTQGGKVIGEVENTSGSSSTVDYEFEGWGIPSEKSG